MKPAFCFTIPKTVDRPSPVPMPSALVVKMARKCVRMCLNQFHFRVAYRQHHVSTRRELPMYGIVSSSTMDIFVITATLQPPNSISGIDNRLAKNLVHLDGSILICHKSVPDVQVSLISSPISLRNMATCSILPRSNQESRGRCLFAGKRQQLSCQVSRA